MSGRVGTKREMNPRGRERTVENESSTCASRELALFVHFQANLERSLCGKRKLEVLRGSWRLEREGSKRRNIAELVGHKDSGGEMVKKVEFETAQGSAPTISERCN